MSARIRHRSTTIGLGLLAAALGFSLLSFALGYFWAGLLAGVRPSSAGAVSLRAFWIPLSNYLVVAATALTGVLGVLFLWHGRTEPGPGYASRMGLALLAFLVAAVAYAVYLFTGFLAGLFPLAGLDPWHALFALVGGVAVGFGLYWVLGHLPVSGIRPAAAIALALGVAGLALLSLPALGVREYRPAGFEGAGLGLAVASLMLWLVLCLYAEETVRTQPSRAASGAAAEG